MRRLLLSAVVVCLGCSAELPDLPEPEVADANIQIYRDSSDPHVVQNVPVGSGFAVAGHVEYAVPVTDEFPILIAKVKNGAGVTLDTTILEPERETDSRCLFSGELRAPDSAGAYLVQALVAGDVVCEAKFSCP